MLGSWWWIEIELEQEREKSRHIRTAVRISRALKRPLPPHPFIPVFSLLARHVLPVWWFLPRWWRRHLIFFCWRPPPTGGVDLAWFFFVCVKLWMGVFSGNKIRVRWKYFYVWRAVRHQFLIVVAAFLSHLLSWSLCLARRWGWRRWKTRSRSRRKSRRRRTRGRSAEGAAPLNRAEPWFEVVTTIFRPKWIRLSFDWSGYDCLSTEVDTTVFRPKWVRLSFDWSGYDCLSTEVDTEFNGEKRVRAQEEEHVRAHDEEHFDSDVDDVRFAGLNAWREEFFFFVPKVVPDFFSPRR